MFGVTNVSSRISDAFLKPASMSPYDQGASVSLPSGRRPALYSSTSACRPFQVLHLRKRRRLARRWGRTYPDVPLHTGIHRTRQQRRDRIHTERQRFPLNLDPVDRFDSRQFVDGRDSQNRFALIEGLVGQRLLAPWVGFDDLARVIDLILGTRHVVGRQNRFHAGHGQRRAGVDALDTRVRVRAQKEPREQHPRRAEIFGVPCATGDLGAEIRG